MKRLLFAMSVATASMLYVMPASALNYSNATGADIVKENASKESGYSSAQLETLQEKLAGKVLTFENGKVFSVSKDFSGKLSVKITFQADTSNEGVFCYDKFYEFVAKSDQTSLYCPLDVIKTDVKLNVVKTLLSAVSDNSVLSQIAPQGAAI